jgi:hypothetical protein
MKVFSSWDSAVVSIYGEVDGHPAGPVREVPEEVYRRYERAQTELQAAEDALSEYFRASIPLKT